MQRSIWRTFCLLWSTGRKLRLVADRTQELNRLEGEESANSVFRKAALDGRDGHVTAVSASSSRTVEVNEATSEFNDGPLVCSAHERGELRYPRKMECRPPANER
jgi:hypothetical protein